MPSRYIRMLVLTISHGAQGVFTKTYRPAFQGFGRRSLSWRCWLCILAELGKGEEIGIDSRCLVWLWIQDKVHPNIGYIDTPLIPSIILRVVYLLKPLYLWVLILELASTSLSIERNDCLGIVIKQLHNRHNPNRPTDELSSSKYSMKIHKHICRTLLRWRCLKCCRRT